MTTTTKKKTRDLPNLTECHSCHVRVDLTKPKNQSNTLQILYSEWRIVLLCTKCLSRVESTALCSYCFNDTLSSSSNPYDDDDDCFRCRRCKRRVHKACDSDHRASAAAVTEEKDSVCADCWVPPSLARWRSVAVRTTNNNSCRRNSSKVGDLQLWRSWVSDDDDTEVESDEDDDVSEVEEEDDPEPRSLARIRSENCGGRGSSDVDDDDDDAEIESEDDEDDSDVEEDPKLSVCHGACGSIEVDDDGALKEGQGSCSNGVVVDDVEDSLPLEDCNCTTTTATMDRIRNTNMEPYYFKYRRKRDDQSVLTYKRRREGSSSIVVDKCDLPWWTYKRKKSLGVDCDFPVLTYKRRNSVDPCYMFSYKRRSRSFDDDDSVVLTYKRRRPENDYVCFMVQLKGRCEVSEMITVSELGIEHYPSLNFAHPFFVG